MAVLPLEVFASLVAPRQITNNNDVPPGFVEEDGFEIPFWQSRTGIIIKWSLFFGLVLLVGLYIVLGHIHARRRIRKGLRPLAYHRWLITRAELASVDPRYAYAAHPGAYTTYRPENYAMGTMPPPVYDPRAPRPPMYEGPEGGSKVDPSQGVSDPVHRSGDESHDEGFSAPARPPPASVQKDDTGRSNNPYRQ